MSNITLLNHGYWIRVNDLTRNQHYSTRAAYDVVEKEVREQYGINRYTTYDSFRARRSQLKAHLITAELVHLEYP